MTKTIKNLKVLGNNKIFPNRVNLFRDIANLRKDNQPMYLKCNLDIKEMFFDENSYTKIYKRLFVVYYNDNAIGYLDMDYIKKNASMTEEDGGFYELFMDLYGLINLKELPKNYKFYLTDFKNLELEATLIYDKSGSHRFNPIDNWEIDFPTNVTSKLF